MSAATSFFSRPDDLREVETFSKPGTADVTPDDRKKLAGLLKHYRGKAHPFSACKRDQLKHGLSEDHANRRCAVIKDLIEGTTKWRGKAKEEAIEILAEALQVVQLATTVLGPRGASAILHETKVEENEDAPWVEELFIAAALVEAAPTWMLPVAARRKGFRPLDPQKRKGGGGAFDEGKHRRAPKGSGVGGQFIRMGSSGTEVAAVQRRVGAAETGTFNKQTKKLIEAFQKRKGIQVDGVIGTQTVAALRGNTSVDPGRLTKNDRRFLRRYARRTTGSSSSPPPTSRRVSSSRRTITRSSSSSPRPIPAKQEDSLPGSRRLGREGWDYHDGMWWPPGHPRNKKNGRR